MKTFIITIDTEGDNLWNWRDGSAITTKNALFLPRFQSLCNKYGFKPSWLTNWEMLHDERFINYITGEESLGHCEIGMHLHAWNNPPYYELLSCKQSGAPYLIEYPFDVMEQKIATITNKFKSIIGHWPISHRAGRWAMHDDYYKLLYKYGYMVDCSITPGINWSNSMGQSPGFSGPDYSKEITSVSNRFGILEVPLTTTRCCKYFRETASRLSGIRKAKYRVKSLIKKERLLNLRPDGTNLAEMKWIVDRNIESNEEYLMFMIHSSELMPSGSPTFLNKAAIEKLYEDLDSIFSYVVYKYEGMTLKEFYEGRTGNR